MHVTSTVPISAADKVFRAYRAPQHRRSIACQAVQQARDYDKGCLCSRPETSNGCAVPFTASVDTEGPWIACLGQAGDSQVCDDDLTELTMHVYFQSQPGEHLSLVGNHAAFGCWDLSKALVLRWTESHVWQTRAAICVEPGTTLEYKYVLFKDFADEPVWQAGKNQVVHIPEDSEGWRFVVEDSWDASRHEHHVEKHDEHALPQPIPLACFECGECLMPHLHWRGCPKVLGGATQGLAAQGPVAA